MNISLASRIITDLTHRGVKTFCLCPGGRSAPFVEVLSQSKGLEILSFFEERSACFFALGRTKRDLCPTAVITTSGTAVAELLPGVIESHYNHLPLVLITADRPFGYGKKGAPQTLKDPLEIFTPYTAFSVNIFEINDLHQLKNWSAEKGSVHLNVAFDIPLVDESIPSLNLSPSSLPSLYPKKFMKTSDSKWENFFHSCQKPLLLVGELKKEEVESVQTLLENYSGAIFTEPLSQLQFIKNRLTSGENILTYAWNRKAIDGVIRLGGIPRTRFWRDLEKSSLPVLNLSSPPFYSGLYKDSFHSPLLKSLPSLSQHLSSLKPKCEDLKRTDQQLSKKWLEILKLHPLSEPHWIWRLKQALPQNSKVFLGNSLPIRVWDLVSLNRDTHCNITGQGGVNGIDGLISRFLGECESSQENWAFLGDLSALYDMQGLWISHKVPPWTLVIINNSGGQIFSRLHSNPAFLNQHSLSFAPLTKMWGLDYEFYSNPQEFHFTKTTKPRLIEIKPDNQATTQCFQAYESLFPGK
ncbi:MAG: 2-succinyl-5-enolpyruvyl-6-hydroxy-3-cyclohexene-1-carboxylic-acid synthase [Bdellovibrionales bacterium]|nr:2-succinyl-5-enolpyruvyl-6-hydroxy-3-cyclohexene-1-carboxylic-acid synthase [Bdellovibrionales bacterium]